MSPPLNRILIVEDDADIQTILELALVDVSGFEIDICNSGLDVLNKVKSFQPHLILLDVMMPEMDGPTTLKRLREELPQEEIPVIFITAKAQTHEVSFYRHLGVLEVIAKPFNTMTLGQEIQEIWDNYYD